MSGRRHRYTQLKSGYKRNLPNLRQRDPPSKPRYKPVSRLKDPVTASVVTTKKNSGGEIISTKKVNLFLKGSQQPSRYDVQRRKLQKKKATQEEETKKVLEEFQRIHANPDAVENRTQRFDKQDVEIDARDPVPAPTPGKKRRYEPSFLPGARKRAKFGSGPAEEGRLTERDKARMRKEMRKQQKDAKREGLESLRKEIEAKRHARRVVGSLGLLADPMKQTTNIYVSNLPKHVTENDLREVFEAYGPISSVKVMWPRTQKELSRHSHHGFVNFVNRQDAENALAKLSNALVWGVKLRFGWGEALRNDPSATIPITEIPPSKIEVPPGHPKVRVKIPRNEVLKLIIDETAMFVNNYGMNFEYLLLERNSPHNERRSKNYERFRFLFAIDTEEHMYYRWKLWSLANGDKMHKWTDSPFQMLEGGPFWIPPTCPSSSSDSRDRKRSSESRQEKSQVALSRPRRITALKPEPDLPKTNEGSMFRPQSRFDRPASANIVYKGSGDPLPPTKAAAYGGRVSKPLTARPLSQENRQVFVSTLRQIKPTRKTIRNAMKFCLDNAEMATEVAEILSEALTTSNKNTEKKLARLYLLHDILNNSSSMVKNASAYPSEFKKSLPEIVKTLHELSNSLKSAEKIIFDKKVLKLYDIWDRKNLYTRAFINRLRNSFLGRKEDSRFKVLKKVKKPQPLTDPNMDGEPMSDGSIDGEPMSDVDGEPMSD